MTITQLSTVAAQFPTFEVEYEDILRTYAKRYLVDGRMGGPGIDCMGVVLEVFRRAGLGLPDPKIAGGGVLEFAELFDQVDDPNTPFDLINVRREANHVAVVVRPGWALSSREGSGAYNARVNNLKRIDGVQFFRVKPDCLPT